MTGSLPVIVDGLDDEAEGGAHGVDVLAHNLLDNGGFASIVKAAASWSDPVRGTGREISMAGVQKIQHQDAKLFVLESGFAEDGQHFRCGECCCVNLDAHRRMSLGWRSQLCLSNPRKVLRIFQDSTPPHSLTATSKRLQSRVLPARKQPIASLAKRGKCWLHVTPQSQQHHTRPPSKIATGSVPVIA